MCSSYCTVDFMVYFLIAPYVFTLDVLLGFSDVVLLRCPGEDGGSTQCSGMACHIVHLVHRSGENQGGEQRTAMLLHMLLIYLLCNNITIMLWSMHL